MSEADRRLQAEGYTNSSGQQSDVAAAFEIKRLQATNAELLAALGHIRRFIQSHEGDDETAGFALGIADAAIAKAKDPNS